MKNGITRNRIQIKKDANGNIVAKMCNKCETWWGMSGYHRDSSNKLGVHSVCKRCKNAANREFVANANAKTPETQPPIDALLTWRGKQANVIDPIRKANTNITLPVHGQVPMGKAVEMLMCGAMLLHEGRLLAVDDARR